MHTRRKKPRVTPLDKKYTRDAKIMEKYYSIAHRGAIEKIRFELYDPDKNLKERKRIYSDIKGIISDLKPIFKERVKELNRIAQKDGYKNHLEFIMKTNGVPKEKLKLLINNSESIIKDINKHLPQPKHLPKWYWSKFNIPAPLAPYLSKRYAIPNDIYNLAKKRHPILKQYIPKIKITKQTDFYPFAMYDEKKKRVIIEMPTTGSIYNMLTFLHELGHAIDLFNLVKKGVDPTKTSRYEKEKQALKFQFDFEDNLLPKNIKNASRGTILGDFLTAFFEYEIYTNPDQDFDRAYAKAHNRCYPLANQHKNPFYVLENTLLDRPCGCVTTSVIEAELLSKPQPTPSTSRYSGPPASHPASAICGINKVDTTVAAVPLQKSLLVNFLSLLIKPILNCTKHPIIYQPSYT